jgi:hypothetical protein
MIPASMGKVAKHKIIIESDSIEEVVQKLIYELKNRGIGSGAEITKKTKISLLPPHGISSEDKDIEDVLIYGEEDLKLLYAALSKYKPTKQEQQRYELLLEDLDEILTADTYD